MDSKGKSCQLTAEPMLDQIGHVFFWSLLLWPSVQVTTKGLTVRASDHPDTAFFCVIYATQWWSEQKMNIFVRYCFGVNIAVKKYSLSLIRLHFVMLQS